MKHVSHHFVLLLEGFVGAGMLSAAVAGSVFASPPARNVLHAIHCVSRGNEGEKYCLEYYF
jgi:dihydroxyacetone kinase